MMDETLQKPKERLGNHFATKLIVFVLCVACFATALLTTLQVLVLLVPRTAEQFFSGQEAGWERSSLFAVAATVCCLVLAALLLVWTGRRRADGTRRLYAWDRLLMEVQLVIICLCLAIFFSAMEAYAHAGRFDVDGHGYSYWPGGVVDGVLAVVACVLPFGMGLWCLSSIVRNFKAQTLARRSLVCIIFKGIWRGMRALVRAVKSGFDGTNPLAKTIVLVALFWLATTVFTWFFARMFIYDDVWPVIFLLLIATLVAALWLAVRWTGRYARLRTGIEEVSAGRVAYRIEVLQDSTAEFDVMARRVNDISSAIARAVEGELKSQRLKTDLISNVSHDLKTPLTSIITYTDLLQKEGLDSPRAADYLNVVTEKGQRLKKLTEDLFEAAKASSGALPVRRERVDLHQLMQQVLAETEEGLAAAGLETVVSVEGHTEGSAAADPAAGGDGEPGLAAGSGSEPGLAAGGGSEPWCVTADGGLLWRVFDNLLNNARKYALPGSRVYIDLRREQQGVTIEIKNTSAAQLNIPASELMERFMRGDENRTTEGSGLGLSIASDLVRLMGGTFTIRIDGDLFKVAIWLGA